MAAAQMNAPPTGEPRKTRLALQAGNKEIYLTKKGADTTGASRSRDGNRLLHSFSWCQKRDPGLRPPG